jgi:hypothetical protein
MSLFPLLLDFIACTFFYIQFQSSVPRIRWRGQLDELPQLIGVSPAPTARQPRLSPSSAAGWSGDAVSCREMLLPSTEIIVAAVVDDDELGCFMVMILCDCLLPRPRQVELEVECLVTVLCCICTSGG